MRNGPEKFFLGWDSPILDLVSRKLIENWIPEKGPLDLGRTLLLVSASGAGRELRSVLARVAAEKGSYLIPPKVLTAEPFLLPRTRNVRSRASEAEMLSAWSKVLLGIEPEECSSIFPVHPGRKDFSWALSTAEMFIGLRRSLSEKGLSVNDVSRNTGLDEPERWMELAGLESGYLAALTKNGLEDPESVKRDSVGDAEPFSEFDRIILACTPDPVPLLIEKLERMLEVKSVYVWINAPSGMEDHFDSWGRPFYLKWKTFTVDLDKDRIISASTADDQAMDVVRQIAEFGDCVDASNLTITAANPNLFQPIREKLEELASSQGQKYRVGNPSGTSVKNTCIYNIVSTLSSLLATGEFQYAESLVRISEVLQYLTGCTEKKCADYISALDDFKLKCLPFSIAHSRKLMRNYRDSSKSDKNAALVERYLESLESLISDYERSPSASAFFRRLLAGIFSGKTLLPASSLEDSEFMEAGKALEEIFESIETAAFLSLCPEKDEQLAVMTRLFENSLIFPATGDNCLEISGWLELPWKSSSKIVIAGMNEGYVPDSITGDVFLPNTMRVKLGLRSNDDKFARDLFLFSSILSSRRGKGDVRIIVGRQDFDGKPMKPSRLLFMCPEGEFISRVERLFMDAHANPPPEPPNLAPAWMLAPEWKPDEIKSVSVTAFKSYLECPFRFYLTRVLKLKDMEYEKFEIDAPEFGDICHEALKGLLSCADTDAEGMGRFLCNRASEILRNRYGDELLVPLMLQEYSIMQRLKKAAEIEAGLRKDGWRTVATEYRIGKGMDIMIHGMPVTGQIDRIDYNPTMKKVRILDYKTSEKDEEPRQTHYNKRKGEWIDLQLPLYRILFDRDEVIKGKIPGDYTSVECGYFNLPKAVSSTGVRIWEDLDNDIPDAEARVGEIIDCIRNNVFWPPAKKVKYEISEWLFPYAPEKCVAAEFAGRASAK